MEPTIWMELDGRCKKKHKRKPGHARQGPSSTRIGTQSPNQARGTEAVVMDFDVCMHVRRGRHGKFP